MLRSPNGNGDPYTFPAAYGDLGGVTAVAGYLNADAGLDYPFRRYTIGEDGSDPSYLQIQTALESENRSKILELKNSLKAANEFGCPLS